MTPHGWIALGILLVAAVLFISRWFPLELTALCIPIALYLTGVLQDPDVVLQGFGNHAVIALASVFVLGAGLQESGVAAYLARGVQQVGGKNEVRLIVVISLAVAVLSAFMSNAATVAVLLPAVVALSRRAEIPASKLLMPMGFSAILGGNLTLIGTAPNLLVSDYLKQESGQGFGMFDFSMIGLPIVIAGILYMLLIGRRFLTGRDPGRSSSSHKPERLVRDYGVQDRLTRLRLGKASKLIGKTVEEAALGSRYGLSIVLIGNQSGLSHKWHVPGPDYRLQRGDDLYLEGEQESMWLLAEEENMRMGLPGDHHVEKVLDHGICLAEFAVAPRSGVLGRSLIDLRFRQEHGLSVLSLWRQDGPVQQGVAEQPLEMGDALLVAGELEEVQQLRRNPDFVLLSDIRETRNFTKAPLALSCLMIALLPPLLGWAPLAISALIGAVLMAATGCVAMRDAGRFIEWKVLFLIIGTLPLGKALEMHGVADYIAGGVTEAAAGFGAAGVLAALFLLATLISITSSNAAAAVILAPVAASAGNAMGLELRQTLLAVAYGCSCAFLVPFAHQCNLMVMAPAGYKTKDFLVVGGGMSLVVIATAIAMLILV